MTFLPQLKDQLVATRPGPAPRRRARVVAVIVLAALLLAAGALAATGVIEIGSKVEPPPAFNKDPELGGGVGVVRSARVLPLRVPDPAGGPPWGLRLVSTTRGLTCVQAGRVVDGRLGAIGQDGVAGDDGRFHELSPRYAASDPGCVPPDAAGNLYIAVDARGLASGEAPRRSCLGPGEGSPGKPRCPVEDHRRFLYGLLGPEASSLDYRNRGRVRSLKIAGPEGAYLIVLAERQRGGGVMAGPAPMIGHPFKRIVYRDGSFCPKPGATQEERRCEPSGYRSPLTEIKPGSVRRPVRIELDGRALRVSFRAPVNIEDARLTYWATAHFEDSCPHIYFVPATNRDVRRGAVVRLDIKLPRRCHGPIDGTVRLSANRTGLPSPPGGDPRTSLLIGRFREHIP